MKPVCIAHRGCHWNCFENTIQSFEAAAKGNFYGVETDIHLTKDKKWIIHHDPDFLSNGEKIIIKEHTLEELVKMPLDNEWNYEAKCPTLGEYLDALKGSGKTPVIEVKPKNPSFHNLRKVIKEVKKRFNLKEVVFIAFYPWPLMKLKIMHPKLRVELLVEKGHMFLTKWALGLGWGLDIESKCLDEELMNKFHKKHRNVNAWTVDSKEELERLEKLGIDEITTNVFDQNS